MSKQKRMIYVYEENVDFYDDLENKSEFINEQMTRARVGEEVKETDSQRKNRENIDSIKARLKNIGK